MKWIDDEDNLIRFDKFTISIRSESFHDKKS